jgi:hypothetical protein
LVGKPWTVSPGPEPPRRALRVCGVLGHTPSSGNVREVQRSRIARVTFPQRLLIRTPLRGCNLSPGAPSPTQRGDKENPSTVMAFAGAALTDVAPTFCPAPGRTAECAGAQSRLAAPIGIAAVCTEADQPSSEGGPPPSSAGRPGSILSIDLCNIVLTINFQLLLCVLCVSVVSLLFLLFRMANIDLLA